jgi:hypothetical protein
MVGCDAGGANAARTTADDEEIDVELSHINPPRNRIQQRLDPVSFFVLTRFLNANRFPLRAKTLCLF